MTDVNHRRKNKLPVNQRYTRYHNGYAHPDNKNLEKTNADYVKEGFPVVTSSGSQRVGRTDFLDKSMHGWGRKSELADRTVGAGIGNDFSNGHRGMAKAVKAAKKYVNSRIRFHENQATKRLTEEE